MPAVPLSVVLRLVERRLAEGQLAGEVEVVDSGRRGLVRTTDELVEFLLAHEPKVTDTPEGT